MHIRKIMIPFLITILVLHFIMPCSANPKSNTLEISAKAAVAIEYYTGQVLYEKSANERLPMASTTKIMTALTVLKLEKNLKREFTIPKIAVNIEGSSMYLIEGEIVTIEELLYGLMLVSGNDVAQALAIAVCGDNITFVDNMNSIAKELGLTDTHFTNTTGLPDDNHYTTALELAKIMSKALEYPKFSEIIATKTKTIKGRGQEKVHLLTNHNRLLNIYEFCLGGKTGFTKTAGRCLVETANKNEKRVISVTLNAPNDWSDHQTILENVFDKIDFSMVYDVGEFSREISVINSNSKKAILTNIEPLYSILINNNLINPYEQIFAENFIFAPADIADTIGVVDFMLNKKILSSSRLVLKESIDILPPLTNWEKIIENLLSILKYL